MKDRKGTFTTSKGYTAKLAQPKYKKYRIIAEGTIIVSNTTVKDIRESMRLVIEGYTIRSKKIVRLERKKDPNIPSSGHL